MCYYSRLDSDCFAFIYFTKNIKKAAEKVIMREEGAGPLNVTVDAMGTEDMTSITICNVRPSIEETDIEEPMSLYT